MSREDDVAQEPVVRLGTTFDIGGRKATVVGFSKKGVQCTVEGVKANPTIDFKMIETALDQQKHG
jgi:hypothetical protein